MKKQQQKNSKFSKKQKWRIFRNKWRESMKPVTDRNMMIACLAGIGGLTEAALSFGTSWGIATGTVLSGVLVHSNASQDKKRQEKEITWTNHAGQEVTSTAVDKDIITAMEQDLKRQYFFARDPEKDSKFKTMFNEASEYCNEAKIKVDGQKLSAETPYIFIRDYQKPVEKYHLVDEMGRHITVNKPSNENSPASTPIKQAQKLKR